jgi:hypothetical protein
MRVPYNGNNTSHINTVCEEKADFLDVKSNGTCSNERASKGQIDFRAPMWLCFVLEWVSQFRPSLVYCQVQWQLTTRGDVSTEPLACWMLSLQVEIYRPSVFLLSSLMLQAGRSRVRFPKMSLDFFNLPNPSSRITTLGSTRPQTEMSTRNLSGSKGRPARKADILTAICKPIV